MPPVSLELAQDRRSIELFLFSACPELAESYENSFYSFEWNPRYEYEWLYCIQEIFVPLATLTGSRNIPIVPPIFVGLMSYWYDGTPVLRYVDGTWIAHKLRR